MSIYPITRERMAFCVDCKKKRKHTMVTNEDLTYELSCNTCGREMTGKLWTRDTCNTCEHYEEVHYVLPKKRTEYVCWKRGKQSGRLTKPYDSCSDHSKKEDSR